MKARTQAVNQLRALLDTAPEELRDELRGLSASGLIRKAARFRPGERPDGVLAATKLALRSVARRCRMLSEEVSELDGQLDWLVGRTAPELVALEGVGVDTAASLLIAVGDNPTRLQSEAAFAHLSGSPRFRLLREGCASSFEPPGQPGRQPSPYVIAFSRMSRDERTRDYVARRTKEGKSKKEIIRCLKRYIAREIYKILIPPSLRESPAFSAP